MAKQLKEIKELPDYYIDKSGQVYSTKVSPRYNPEGELREVRPRFHPSGYLYYGLFKGKGPSKLRIWRRAHRLVWEAFVGKIPTKLEIDHKNRNKQDNRLSNLRLVTHSENCKNTKRKKHESSSID